MDTEKPKKRQYRIDLTRQMDLDLETTKEEANKLTGAYVYKSHLVKIAIKRFLAEVNDNPEVLESILAAEGYI